MPAQMLVEFPASWRRPESAGYGTYPGPYNYERLERYTERVTKALALGYRHIDTAQAYENEAYIGQAIQASQVPRDDIFLTSKLDSRQNCYQGALKGIAESKRALGTIPDMYLIHYPGDGSAIEAWRGLVEAKAKGQCRRIGVSNFEENHLTILFERTDEAPAINQIEFHPYLWSERLSNLVSFCHQHGILVEGYCSLAQQAKKTNLLQESVVRKIAAHHGLIPARVVLRWSMQHGVRPLVGSLKEEQHLSENLGPYDFVLTPQEMSQIDALGALQRRLSLDWGWDPPNAVLS